MAIEAVISANLISTNSAGSGGDFQACCFTGHRDISHDLNHLSKIVEQVIMSLSQKNVKDFYCGGAVGFDNLCAMAVLSLKAVYPTIKLRLVLPCRNHFIYWSQNEIEQFKYILNSADSVHYVTESYSDGCTQKRNRYMVDNSDVCVSYLRQETGGTAYTVRYAEKQNKPIIKI